MKVPKFHAGEEFSDLNMLTKLLTHPGKTSASAPSIEAIGHAMCVCVCLCVSVCLCMLFSILLFDGEAYIKLI